MDHNDAKREENPDILNKFTQVYPHLVKLMNCITYIYINGVVDYLTF